MSKALAVTRSASITPSPSKKAAKKAPPKKAAKKAATKGAKKAPPKKAAKKSANPQTDARRAFEHLGRVRKLIPSLSADARTPLAALVQLAEASLQQGDSREAAHLLRASEHLAFADLPSAADHTELSPQMVSAIQREYDDLRGRGENHRNDSQSRAVQQIQRTARTRAAEALKQKRYEEALEFIRAAEALGHTGASGQTRLSAAEEYRRLSE